MIKSEIKYKYLSINSLHQPARLWEMKRTIKTWAKIDYTIISQVGTMMDISEFEYKGYWYLNVRAYVGRIPTIAENNIVLERLHPALVNIFLIEAKKQGLMKYFSNSDLCFYQEGNPFSLYAMLNSESQDSFELGIQLAKKQFKLSDYDISCLLNENTSSIRKYKEKRFDDIYEKKQKAIMKNMQKQNEQDNNEDLPF